MKLDHYNKFRIFYSFGIIGFILAIIGALWFDLGWWFLVAFIYCKLVTLVGVHVGYHRYFTHSAFKTTPLRHKILCWIGFLSGEGTAIAYVIYHHHHHKYTDEPIDIQSPNAGFFSASLWNLRPASFFKDKQITNFPKRLYRDPTVKFITDNYYVLWFIFGIIALLVSWKFFLFFVLMPIGHNNLSSTFVSTLMHLKLPGAYKSYETGESSFNNKIIQSWVLGEGLHNNHHHQPLNYSHAFHSGEFDPAAWVIDKFFIVKENNNGII